MAIKSVHHMLQQRKVELVWGVDLGPQHVLMTSLSGHNSYELHMFGGTDQKERALEAWLQNYKHISNILFVVLKFSTFCEITGCCFFSHSRKET